MEFKVPFKVTKMPAGSNLLIEGEYTTLTKQGSVEDTDITFQQIIKGKEVDVLTSIEYDDVNVLYIHGRGLFLVDSKLTSFNIKQFHALITSDTKHTKFNVPVIFIVQNPFFKVIIDGEEIYTDTIVEPLLPVLKFKKKILGKDKPDFKNGEEIKEDSSIQFLEDCTITSVDGAIVNFHKGDVKKVWTVLGGYADISGYDFDIKDLAMANIKVRNKYSV